MDQTVFSSKIKELCDFSNKLHVFENDEEGFLGSIKGLDRKYLEEELEKFRKGSVLSNRILKPVNFLKFLVLDKILSGKNISLALIDEFKNKILARDVDYFKAYPDFKEPMLNLEEEKKIFQQWNKIFRILFYVYYDQYKDNINATLTDISQHLKAVLNMKDSKSTINGFGWNNNYGSSNCWIALYPSNRDTHQKAYQIFFNIEPDNQVIYGMKNGAKMKKEEKLDTQDGSNINTEKLEDFLFKKAKPVYEQFNSAYVPEVEGEKTGKIIPVDEKRPKNVILYGPPGTGKTYQAYEEAVKIVDPKFPWKTRKDLIAKFRELQGNGYITFVTFHQSYSYEEFIEGYRYDGESKVPKVEPGVFKTLVASARADYLNPKKKINLNFSKRNVFKMSLGNTLEGDEDIYEYCKDNNVIALGWGQDIYYSEADTKEKVRKSFEAHSKRDEDDSAFNITAINYFKNIMKKEDLVFVSKGNRALRAIGKVIGAYYFDKDSPIDYSHFRKVEWIFTDIDIPVEKVMRRNFSQQTIYEIKKTALIEANLDELLSKPGKEKKDVHNYVLIIDEINRGNISRIFGELITLLEDDKRLEAENEMVVKLPYSKDDDFGIPPNIFVIGTMNTADRSIALMDVALRRRFSFRKVAPDSDIIASVLSEKEVNEEFIEILQETYDLLNKRIRVLLDEDHMIGHSYFLKIGTDDSEIVKI